MTQLNFDASQIAPSTGQADPVPAGWYVAAIDQTEMKPTKDGMGSYLEVRYSIMEGQYINHKVYQRLNLRNNNQQAQEIAYRDLSAICHATGIMQVSDSMQLHGRPVRIKVKLRPADGQYEASNEISAVKNMSEQVGGQEAPATPIPGLAPVQPTGFAQPGGMPAPTQFQAQGMMQQPAPVAAPMAAPQQPWQAPVAAPMQQPAPVQGVPMQQPVQAPAAPAAPAGMPPWAMGQPQ